MTAVLSRPQCVKGWLISLLNSNITYERYDEPAIHSTHSDTKVYINNRWSWLWIHVGRESISCANIRRLMCIKVTVTEIHHFTSCVFWEQATLHHGFQVIANIDISIESNHNHTPNTSPLRCFRILSGVTESPLFNLSLIYIFDFTYYPLYPLNDIHMMTSSNGNIFRVTSPLCGEFTGPGEFPAQRPVTRSFDVFFDLRLNKRLSKQPRGWWFDALSWSLWRHRNEISQVSPQLSIVFVALKNGKMTEGKWLS